MPIKAPFRKTQPLPSNGGKRPPVAVELAPEGALAAIRADGGQSITHAFAPLAPGALTPGIAEANIQNAQAVTDTLRAALDQVAPGKKNVTLIIPDTAARVFVVDFDTLSSKPAEAIPVLRFRLRKMVPFDVESSSVSYQVLPTTDGAYDPETGAVRVLALIMPGAILDEYESAVRAAGYEPGAVLPSSLAALAALDTADAALTASLSNLALTTSVTRGNDLLLYRTVDLPADNATRVGEVQRSIAVASAWFEDHLGRPPRELYYAGAIDPREFARAVDDPKLTIRELVPSPSTGALTSLGPIGFAGVAGALAGATAGTGGDA